MNKFTVRIEHADGNQFNLAAWRKSVLKGQDMEAWQRENPEEFMRNLAAWIKGQLICAIENLDVVVEPAPEIEALAAGKKALIRIGD